MPATGGRGASSAGGGTGAQHAEQRGCDRADCACASPALPARVACACSWPLSTQLRGLAIGPRAVPPSPLSLPAKSPSEPASPLELRRASKEGGQRRPSGDPEGPLGSPAPATYDPSAGPAQAGAAACTEGADPALEGLDPLLRFRDPRAAAEYHSEWRAPLPALSSGPHPPARAHSMILSAALRRARNHRGPFRAAALASTAALAAALAAAQRGPGGAAPPQDLGLRILLACSAALAALAFSPILGGSRPRAWQLASSALLAALYASDAVPLLLGGIPARPSALGCFRVSPLLAVLAVVLGGQSWLSSALVGAAWTAAAAAATASGALARPDFGPAEVAALAAYVLAGAAVSYAHEGRIKQAWTWDRTGGRLPQRRRTPACAPSPSSSPTPTTRPASPAPAPAPPCVDMCAPCAQLRTPLHGIIGTTDLLFETELDAEQAECLQTIRRCTENLLATERPFVLREALEDVAGILYPVAQGKGVDLACSVEGRLAGAACLGDAARLKQVLINLASNGVKFASREVSPDSIRGGSLALLGPGQVMIRAAPAEAPRAGDPRPWLRLSVKDNGIGIPAGKMGRLFLPFSQIDAKHTRKYGGSGLGLSLVKAFVERMGGRVSVSSTQAPSSSSSSPSASSTPTRQPRARAPPAPRRPPPRGGPRRSGCGRGARGPARERCGEREGREGEPAGRLLLPVRLAALREALRSCAAAAAAAAAGARSRSSSPAAPAPAAPAAPSALEASASGPCDANGALSRPLAAPSPPPPLPWRATRILVAEDNSVNAVLLGKMLSRLGFEHEIVADGLAAVQACRTGRFQALITDIQMPLMDGFEVCAAVRGMQAGGELPASFLVLGCSANASGEDRARGARCGMAEYVVKPCRMPELRAVLGRLGLMPEPEPEAAPKSSGA
eukprot:tig00020556_g11036.t1